MIRQGALTQGELHLAFWGERLTDASYVYVIQAGDDSPVKVGTAKDVEARIDGLQTGNARRLRLLHVLPGDYCLEWNLHQRLKADQVLGEWFDGPLVPEFLTFVERMADKMVAAYAGGATAPHYSAFALFDMRAPKQKPAPAPKPKRRRVWRQSGPAGEVTVRYVEPDPTVDPDVAKQMRESVKGCDRSVYLGPANSITRQRLSRHPDYH